VDKPVEGRSAPHVATLAQPLPESGARHPLGVAGGHHLAVGFDRRPRLRRWRQRQRRGHQLGAHLHGG
jgi:hypothetical protein